MLPTLQLLPDACEGRAGVSLSLQRHDAFGRLHLLRRLVAQRRVCGWQVHELARARGRPCEACGAACVAADLAHEALRRVLLSAGCACPRLHGHAPPPCEGRRVLLKRAPRRKNIAEGQKMNDFGFSDIFLASHRKITKNCFARMESLTPKLMNEGFPIKPG